MVFKSLAVVKLMDLMAERGGVILDHTACKFRRKETKSVVPTLYGWQRELNNQFSALLHMVKLSLIQKAQQVVLKKAVEGVQEIGIDMDIMSFLEDLQVTVACVLLAMLIAIIIAAVSFVLDCSDLSFMLAGPC